MIATVNLPSKSNTINIWFKLLIQGDMKFLSFVEQNVVFKYFQTVVNVRISLVI